MRAISKILSAVVLSVCILAHNSQPAQAFFTENYKKNLNYGVFKKANNTDLYLGVNASFLMKTWIPNITTTVMGSKKWLDAFNSSVPGYMTKNPISKYSYGLGISAGLHSNGSNFRHELMFEWYSLLSKPMQLKGGEILPTSKEGETIQAIKIGGKYYKDIGVYSNIYRVTYNMYYNFQNVFNLFNTDWDIYLGIGAGLAIVRAGIYSSTRVIENKKVRKETIPASESSSGTGTGEGSSSGNGTGGDSSSGTDGLWVDAEDRYGNHTYYDPEGNEISYEEYLDGVSRLYSNSTTPRVLGTGDKVKDTITDENGNQIITIENTTYALEKSSISTASSAGNNKLMAKNYFAAAYQFQVGVLANLSQSFAMNIGVTFAGTSRPFFSTDFKSVKGVAGSRMNFEYHIALNVGLLIKSMELAI